MNLRIVFLEFFTLEHNIAYNLYEILHLYLKPTTGVVTIKVPGIYFVNVMFGVTKKAWYLHLRKNGVYIASVQKDYNQGYEDSLNLHAIGNSLYV